MNPDPRWGVCRVGVPSTILREFGGAEEAGDPERLLGTLQRLVVGRDVGFGERLLQVARAVGQTGVLLTLGRQRTQNIR